MATLSSQLSTCALRGRAWLRLPNIKRLCSRGPAWPERPCFTVPATAEFKHLMSSICLGYSRRLSGPTWIIDSLLKRDRRGEHFWITAAPQPGRSNHIMVLLVPSYRQKFKPVKPWRIFRRVRDVLRILDWQQCSFLSYFIRYISSLYVETYLAIKKF